MIVRHAFAGFLCVVLTACGSSIVPVDGSRSDATDVLVHDGGCTGTTSCRAGTPGHMCSMDGNPATCTGGTWTCGAGTVLESQCACFGTQPGQECGNGCPGPMPSDGCVSGTPGGACGDAALARTCVSGSWLCPPGTIPISQCACVGRPPGSSCVCSASGWRCADAGVSDASAGCTDCVTATVTWGWEGGFVAYTDVSDVSACRTFTFTRQSGGGPPDRSCTSTVPACGAGDTPNVGDLEAALADPDMVHALAVAPVLYGVDTRPVDGSVYRIDVGGRRVDVGSDCVGSAGCTPVPPGVARARDFLQGFTQAQIRLGTCATAFPDGGI